MSLGEKRIGPYRISTVIWCIGGMALATLVLAVSFLYKPASAESPTPETAFFQGSHALVSLPDGGLNRYVEWAPDRQEVFFVWLNANTGGALPARFQISGIRLELDETLTAPVCRFRWTEYDGIGNLPWSAKVIYVVLRGRSEQILPQLE